MKLYFLYFLVGFPSFLAAQYAPSTGNVGSTAISKDDSRIIAWARHCTVVRGLQNIADSSLGYSSFGNDYDALGIANGTVVSLGDGGFATCTFYGKIQNGEGFDFAVFENAFKSDFLELAHVEVSTDGINYVRFPSHSLTQTQTQVGSFGLLDATKINNLAGKYEVFYGTPFDLEELKDSILIDVNNINFVRIIDVVGSIDSLYGSKDFYGNFINDPFPTPFESSGFDLDAVAVLNGEIDPELSIYDKIKTSFCNDVTIKSGNIFEFYDAEIFTLQGSKISMNQNRILEKGIYILKTKKCVSKLIVY